jgi:hypothetical protein
VTDEGTFSMNKHRSLRRVIMRTGGPVRSARREPSVRTVRSQAMRGILIPALVLASLGATAAASPGHGTSDHIQASAKRSCKIDNRPWIYAAVDNRPWIYAAVGNAPRTSASRVASSGHAGCRPAGSAATRRAAQAKAKSKVKA